MEMVKLVKHAINHCNFYRNDISCMVSWVCQSYRCRNMKTRTSGHFYIFKTKKAEIGLNETPKKTIHIFPKTQRMQIRVQTSWDSKDDIVIKDARNVIIEKTLRHPKWG